MFVFFLTAGCVPGTPHHAVMEEIAARAGDDPEWIHGAPYHAVVGRLDETRAAREARLVAPEQGA